MAFKSADALASATNQLSNLKEGLADQKIAEANERAGRAEQSAGEANERAAKANLLAEQERLARVKIEERLAWRRISPRQHDVFVEELKPFAGSLAVVSAFSNADIESKTFASDISQVLKDAGWKAPLDLTNTTSNLPVGIVCRLDTSKAAGSALKMVLQKLPGGVEVIHVRFNDAKESIGSIVVGLRPPP
jgi:hypothetical protein